MKVYFVRHAQSANNAMELLHNYPSGELSEFGEKQAQFVAKRFKHIAIDLVLSSNHERAKKTAEIINKVLKKPIESTDLLGEFRGPKEIEGRHKNDPEVVRISHLMNINRHDPHWKFSDEESHFELVMRANKLLQHLSSLEAEHVLCITHGLFLRVLLAVMMHGTEIKRDILAEFIRFVRIENTGITMCELLPHKEWRLLTLNDYAHLG